MNPFNTSYIKQDEDDIEVCNINKTCVICIEDDLEGTMTCPAEQCNLFCCKVCEKQFIGWVQTNGICPQCKEKSVTIEPDEIEIISDQSVLYKITKHIIISLYTIIPIYFLTENELLFKIIVIYNICYLIIMTILLFMHWCKGYVDGDEIELYEQIKKLAH